MASDSPHPIVLSPTSRFATTKYNSHSRSPSRSPTRRQTCASYDGDSLLSTLSPVSTLEALRATEVIDLAPGSRQLVLSNSIAHASTSERALAIRAALAGKKLREWCKEVKEWQWPKSGFQQPSQDDNIMKQLSAEHNGLLDQAILGGAGAVGSDATEGTTYWGSLQARIVQRYEERIEIIKDDMGKLELEELKDHVRGAYLGLRSKHSSLYGTQFSDSPLARYSHLDDFTVIITATIMQALPYLSRLDNLLDIWITRLVVLRQVPSFLRQLEDAQLAVDSAWKAIKGTRSNFIGVRNGQLELTREAFSTMKLVLQNRVTELGQRLDTMLDALEGRVDRLPECWIDSMESVQDDYESWVVSAERLVEEREWKHAQAAIKDFTLGTHSDEVGVNDTVPIPEEIASDVLQPLGDHDNYPRTSSAPPMSQTIAINASGVDGNGEMIGNRSQPKQQDFISSAPATAALKHTNGLESKNPPSGWSNDVSTAFDDRTYPSEDQVRQHQLDGSKSLSKPSQFGQGVTNRRTPTDRLPPLDIMQQMASTDSTVSSDASDPGSATSEYYSNMSSPEILDAARVEYFKTPVEDRPISWAFKDGSSMSDVVSRHSSQRTDRSSTTIKDVINATATTSPISRSRASSFLPEGTIFEDWASPSVKGKERSTSRQEPGLKRASIASIEVLPRSELRNIKVRRSGSQSSNSSGLSHFKDHSGTPETFAATSNDESFVSSKDRLGAFHASSRMPSDERDSPRVFRQPRYSSDDQPSPDLPCATLLPLGTPEEQGVRSEPAAVLTLPIIDQNEITTPLHEPKSIRSPKKALISPSQSIEDQLTARITTILTNIPAHIRLASGPDADIPEAVHVEEPTDIKEADNLSPPLRLPKLRSPTPSITLAPAFSSNSKAKLNNSDPDIKLYHLHQPGKDVPTKLYVRLVGEAGERVMVRVGGGWADLGEYLKEYASHHGGRSVSDSRFEIRGLPSGSQPSSLATLSGRSTPTSRPPSPTARPLSSHNSRKTRLSGVSNPSTPDMPIRFTDMTSSSADSSARSLRSSSFSWMDEDKALGLAGPKSRKGDISPGKKAWVEGVMEQARKASVEKKKAGPGDIVDLGKVGTTRRVFWKGKGEEKG